MRYDVFPDIHGQSGKLKRRLEELGYQDRNDAWRHTELDRQCLFLGDFIDRGSDNAGVMDIVRRMIDAGTAAAVIGNHELNAIHFHTADPETGDPLRVHSEKNIRQHASFLAEYPMGLQRTADAVNWMRSLPLFLEFDGFRLVHACWNDAVIGELRELAPAGVLTDEQIVRAGRKGDHLHQLVEITTKGPEARLPEGFSFMDKDGTERNEVRLKWWTNETGSWADLALSVPDLSQLPDCPLPEHLRGYTYPATARPVFFGHYWLTGTPVLQAPNALCLDYSAGKDGPLVSYHLGTDDPVISLGHLSGLE